MSAAAPQPVATVLPFEAREKLRRAALTEVTEQNPLARLIAIEAAVAFIKMQYPQFFKEDYPS